MDRERNQERSWNINDSLEPADKTSCQVLLPVPWRSYGSQSVVVNDDEKEMEEILEGWSQVITQPGIVWVSSEI